MKAKFQEVRDPKTHRLWGVYCQEAGIFESRQKGRIMRIHFPPGYLLVPDVQRGTRQAADSPFVNTHTRSREQTQMSVHAVAPALEAREHKQNIRSMSGQTPRHPVTRRAQTSADMRREFPAKHQNAHEFISPPFPVQAAQRLPAGMLFNMQFLLQSSGMFLIGMFIGSQGFVPRHNARARLTFFEVKMLPVLGEARLHREAGAGAIHMRRKAFP